LNREAVISGFVDRLQRQIAELLPSQSVDAVLDQVRRVLRQGFDELDLVSRRDLAGHVQSLEELRRKVERLERRVRELEGTDRAG
jgi:BMFP domain-containing protein YqiC